MAWHEFILECRKKWDLAFHLHAHFILIVSFGRFFENEDDNEGDSIPRESSDQT